MLDRSGHTAAAELFSTVQQDLLSQLRRVNSDRRNSELLALIEEARQVLIRTALVELAEAQTPDLFSDALPYGFGPEAVQALNDLATAEGVPGHQVPVGGTSRTSCTT